MNNVRFQPLIYAILIITGILLGKINNVDSHINNEDNSKINNILNLIKDHYVDTINNFDFEEKTVNAILNELDPHSSYISTKKIQSIEEDMQGSFSGIGVEFNIIEDSIVVISAISGGPSKKLGIRSGDRIIKVEEENVAGIEIKNEGVIKRLRGEKGSIVNISIKRRGEKNIIYFSIKRDDIPLYSVDTGIMLEDNIGYIKISRFAATTYNEMMKKVEFLQNKGMSKLILDLRGNPGGYLQIANQICDEFLKNGELIVFTEGRNRKREETFATQNGQLENLKIIALINEGSASASEIVAGALQDNDRGIIIGRRSFGKGLVQEQISLKDGSALRLTTQRYYTPSGRCIQKDYKVNKDDYYLEQYTRNGKFDYPDSLKYTTKNGRTVYGGGGINPDIIVKRDSSLNFLFINQMISKGWVNTYCFEKSELLQTKNINNYNQININNIYKSFLRFAKQKDKEFKIKLGEKETKYFKNLLLATIARNLWGNDTYHEILIQEDDFILKAKYSF